MQHGTPDEILSNPKNDFVRDFVGNDRALKRLTLFSVKDLISNIDHFNKRTSRIEYHDFAVKINTDLRTALSIILSSPTKDAWVLDENDRRIGLLSLADFENIEGIHSMELKSIVN
jgi:osmoprotectant transport system ATP-binding protein